MKCERKSLLTGLGSRRRDPIVIYNLLDGFTPFEKYWSLGMIIPNIWKNRNCSKPPTSYSSVLHLHTSLCLVSSGPHDVRSQGAALEKTKLDQVPIMDQIASKTQWFLFDHLFAGFQSCLKDCNDPSLTALQNANI